MNRRNRAGVMLAAMRTWTRTTPPTPSPDEAVRLDIRAAPHWAVRGTVALTAAHAEQVLSWLQADITHRTSNPAAYLRTWLDHQHAAGRRTITTRDLLDIAHTLNHTKTAIAHLVDDLIDDGALHPSRWRNDTWHITPPLPAWAIRPGLPHPRR